MATPLEPQWLVPATPGALSNKRASNTTTDRIAAQFRYTGTAVGSTPGSIRAVVQRTVVEGVPVTTPNYVWDSAWVGNFATAQFPAELTGIALGPQAAISVGPRLYVLVPSTGPFGSQSYTVGTIVSTAINGANLGTWRYETPVQPVLAPQQIGTGQPPFDSCNPGALAYAGGYLYALGQKNIYNAFINADGSLGPWKVFTTLATNPGSAMAGWNHLDGGAIVVATALGGSTLIYTGLADANGVATAGGGAQTAIGLNRQYGAIMVDGNGYAYYFGGEDGAGTPQASVYYSSLNLVTGVIGPWTTATSLPGPRTRFGFAYVYSPSTFWPGAQAADSSAQLVGGQATAGGAPLNSVVTNVGSVIRSGPIWSTYVYALPTPTRSCAACITGSENGVVKPSQGLPFPGYLYSSQTALGYESAVDATAPWSYVTAIGGFTTGGVATRDVQSTSIGAGFGGTGLWYKGAQPTLTGAALGNGGAVVVNADGTVDVTFPIGGHNVGGFGVAMGVSTLRDGDQLQLYIQVADALTGDVATSQSTVIKIGQPPTLSSVLPAAGAISTGRPTGSFTYVQGPGGGPEAYWRITVTLAGSVVFDTDLRPDLGNSADISMAPYLLSGSSYTITSTAASTDTPYPGSSASATATAIVTPNYTAPAAPT